jgi:hypothetical protein
LGRARGAVRGALAACGFAATLALAQTAKARPQGHVAVRGAVCGVGADGRPWEETRFCSALVGDLLFFRERSRGVGFGPYLELGSAGFWDARFGGGGSLLLPVSEVFPLVVSVGIYDHELRTASLGATVFWGARSYNYTSSYNWALGVYASAYRDWEGRDTLISMGVEVDGFFIAAPFIYAFQALR